MGRFRKKPVEVEAQKFDGSRAEMYRLAAWILGEGQKAYVEDGYAVQGPDVLHIETLEGPMRVSDGDWIIKGVQGEFYPCKPDIFNETYERVEVRN